MLCTSADYDLIHNAQHRLLAGLPRRRGGNKAGVLHYGYPVGPTLTLKENAKRMVYETAWRAADWDNLLMANPVVHEGLMARGSSLAARTRLLPDPVPPPLNINASEARARLGIPIDGRYVGFVGMMDRRKAIPELCAAFANSSLRHEARLLLAGRMASEFSALLEGPYAPLLRCGRIVRLDQRLSEAEVLLGYAAVDVHAVLQYRRINLSANVLKAVSFGKLVVVDDHGHTGTIARRFDAGGTCDVSDAASVEAALERAAARIRPHVDRQRPPLDRVPSASARVALAAACGPGVYSVLGLPQTGDWVCEGLV